MDQTLKPTVVSLICNFGLGGAQRFHAIQARALSRSFNLLEVVFDEHELPKIYDSGLKPISLGGSHRSGMLGKFQRIHQRVGALRRLIQREKAVLTISHMLGANYINACTLTGEKKIFLIQGSILHDEDTWGRGFWLRTRLLMPLLYQRADANVAVSQGIENELKGLRIPRSHTITNCADLATIDGLMEEPVGALEEVFESCPTLVWSGRFCPQKRPELILDIFAQARRSIPNLKLFFLGDGPQRPELVQKCQAYGLIPSEEAGSSEGDVFFLGTVANPFAFLKRATLYVLNSGWEGFPLALCEALACGCVSLCSDCPTGPREILAPSNLHFRYDLGGMERTPYGVLLPRPRHCNFERAWAEAVVLMVKDRPGREAIKVAARERARTFDQTRVCQQWEELIGLLLERQRS